MSSYNQVDNEFWADTIDWPADERDLAIYLLTCEYRNQEGLFRIRTAQIVIDRAWEQARVEAAIVGLTARGWCIHEHGWMLLTKSLRWAPPVGSKQVPGAARKVKTVPRDSRVWREFYNSAVRFAPEFAAVLDSPPDTPPGTPDTVSSAPDTGSFSTHLCSTQAQTQTPRAGAPAAVAALAVAPQPDEVVVTPPPPPLPPEVDRAADLLDKAGVMVLSYVWLVELAEKYPQVDLVAAVRSAITKHQAGGLRNPEAYIRAIVTADDPPVRKPSREERSRARKPSPYDARTIRSGVAS